MPRLYSLNFGNFKGKGKSSGANIIIHVHISTEEFYILVIYDQGDMENISDIEIAERVKNL